jgi:hypothetical protein
LFEGVGIAATCHSADQGRLLDVVPARSGYQLVCESTGVVAATGIQETEVRCYRLDLTALRRAVAAALEARANPTPIKDLHSLCSVGDVSIDQNMTIPVYLMLPATVKLFMRELQDLSLRSDPGFIVMTSHDAAIDNVTASLIRSKQGFICLLSDAIGWDGQAMSQLSAWQGIVDSYRAQHLTAIASARGLTVTKPKRSTKKKRADRAPKIELIKKALRDHILAARDHAFSAHQRGDTPQLLPRPSKAQLAKIAGVQAYDVSRCFKDDPQLAALYDMADRLDDVMQFGR